MKKTLFFAGLLFLCSSTLYAGGGQIYGTIIVSNDLKYNQKIQSTDTMEILVECQGRKQNTYTDRSGSYRMFLSYFGECSLSVKYNEQWTTKSPVYVTAKPIRYNFRIHKRGDQYNLIRE